MTVATMGADLERTETPRQEGVLQKLAHDDATRAEIARVLPASVPLDRFERAARTAILQTPELAECEQGSLFRSLVKCAMDGLLPDGREAALVAYYNNKTKQKEAQYLPMIFGVRKIAGESGWTIHTFVIYENDQFEVDLGAGLPIHRPAPLNTDRGEMIGAWAKATHKDGRATVVEVMRGEDIKRSQAVSKTGDKDFSPWKTWTDRMWEKTVGHRIVKKLPLDPQAADRLSRVIDATELPPEDAAAALYGEPARTTFSELPSGVQSVPQPADDATDEPASPVGGDPRGSSDEERSAGPQVPDEDPAAAAASPELDDDAVMFAAAAAETVPPTGRYAEGGAEGPLDLAAILDLGEPGRKYLDTVLRKSPNEEFRGQVEAFARLHMPDEYAAMVAARDAKAA